MLYVVTAVHNRYSITEKFISQLQSQTNQEYRLVLVDDGSTDGTVEMVLSKLPTSIILKGNGNLWWGGALHKAYQYLKRVVSDDDIVFLCNDDITIDIDFLNIGCELISMYPKKLISAKGLDRETGAHIDGAEYRNPITADGTKLSDGVDGNCASTRALFIKGDVYKRIGGMHPILLPHYCSDFEYTLRAARKGYPSVTFDRLKVLVHMDSTGDARRKSIKHMFSKRYMNNPIYKLNFILLVTPLYLLPAYIWNLLKRKR